MGIPKIVRYSFYQSWIWEIWDFRIGVFGSGGWRRWPQPPEAIPKIVRYYFW